METRQWTTMDKSTWSEGPWQTEPDKMQWTDEATGLPCLAKRNQGGALCGYVGVPGGHPWYRKDYDDIDLPLGVHGGLTYADHCQEEAGEAEGICHIPGPGEPDDVWWLGFDCAHCYDLSPATNARLRRYNPGWEERWKTLTLNAGVEETYRDLVYVQAQCRSLAQQIADTVDLIMTEKPC